MGRDAAPLGQLTSGAVHLGGDEGPDITGEGAQLLDPFPAGCDRLQRWGRQGPLAAVVEVSLVVQCWAKFTKQNLTSTARLTKNR